MTKRPEDVTWIADLSEIRSLIERKRRGGQSVGIVPTMGNLHEGHASLIRRARAEADFVVTTIFVNPTQFAAGEDYKVYPRTPEQDRELCADAGSDAIFAPTVDAMYPPGASTRVQVPDLEAPLCGRSRPGHFVGVATVVAKLFHIVPADIAYFGRKDYQQTKVIERMVLDLNFPIEIRVCPIVREPDGLALSSRNSYLTADERRQATVLRRSLDLAEELVRGGERDPQRISAPMVELISGQPLARIDYVELVHPDTLEAVSSVDQTVVAAVAVRFGKARLIDNEVIAVY